MVASVLSAQIPQWVLHPKYSSIKLLGNGYYVVSLNGKYGMMNSKEEVVVPLEYDNMSQFKDGMALLYQNGKFVAFVDDKGRLTDIAAHSYAPVASFAFADDYLLVSNRTGYYFVHAKTGATIGPFSDGMPFSEGYAAVKIPKSLKHVFDGTSVLQYISADTGQPVSLPTSDIDADDVDFLSSVSNGKSIVVAKKRVYEYDFSDGSMRPLSMDGTDNKKARVYTPERLVAPVQQGKGYVVALKDGSMSFDDRMRLTAIRYNGQEPQFFDVPEDVEPEPVSAFRGVSFDDTELLGLSYHGDILLPAQFERISKLVGDEALVQVNGKYGVLTVDTKRSCRFILNDNLDIGFEHKTVNTNIKVVCPPTMKLSQMSLTSCDTACTINSDTRSESSNVESAVLRYECTLSIPKKIGLERSSAKTAVALNYDGLKFAPQEISFNAWYVNNYYVELPKHQITGGKLEVDIQVKYTGESDHTYFKKVSVEAEDSVISTITKVTEELYKAQLYNWKNDKVEFSVDVTEDDCPTISYPFSLEVKNSQTGKQKTQSATVTKPVAKARLRTKKPTQSTQRSGTKPPPTFDL